MLPPMLSGMAANKRKASRKREGPRPELPSMDRLRTRAWPTPSYGIPMRPERDASGPTREKVAMLHVVQ